MFKRIKNLLRIGLLLFITASVYDVKTKHSVEPVVAAETKTIYLKTNENWREHEAWFAAYMWVDGVENSDEWFRFISTDNNEIFVAELPVTPFNRIIFTRHNPESNVMSWETRWTQSADIEYKPSDTNNMYALREGEWDGHLGSWTTYLPVIIEPDPDAEIEPSVYTLHYWRNDGRQTLYDLWLWSEGQAGKAYPFLNTVTIEGKVWRTMEVASTFFKSPRYLDIIIKRGAFVEQTPDIRIDVTDYPLYMDGETPRRDFFLVDMETTVYPSVSEAVGEKILDARFTKANEVTVTTYHAPASYEYKVDGVIKKSGNVSTTEEDFKHKFTINVDNNVDITKAYEVSVTFKGVAGVVKTKLITLEGIYSDNYFVNNLTYEGSDLGVTYTPQKTTFKVWAPTSSDLKINLYENGTPEAVDKTKGSDVVRETLQMVRGEKGTWEVTKNGDLHGLYYTLVSTNAQGTTELTDPYAKAAGVSGIRGMIVDFSKTNPTGWDNVTYSTKKPTEIVPYELHVSDLSADATWNGKEEYRKNFLGLIQRGTMYEKNGQAVKTGFDHILELGVNAVQILPFYDQQNDETDMEFNWGYNPQNYNVLEGGYSSDPHNGLVRINEFKQVVQAYAAHDIRIIMDVVYNHVASISQHSFTKLVPGYYFRYKEDGAPDNSSGVGNVTASERIMMERFMRDSTAFWAEEYKIGGFRFDLMGLHTVKAMNTLATKLKTIRNDIIIYGEPWNMDGMGISELATQGNVYKMQHVGAFNDAGRDAIKGGSWDTEARAGWLQVAGQGVDDVIYATLGRIAYGTTNPSQVVNYISVHDNFTIYDHLQTANRLRGFNYDRTRLKTQALQAEAVSLLSQGVGFMHAGSEMLRSKPIEGGAAGYFDHNSYESSYQVNSIKWDEKWDNMAHYNAYRQLVALKRHSQAFNYSTRAEVDANSTVTKLNDSIIKLTYKAGADNYTLHHHGAGSSMERLNDLNGREVVLDTSGTYARGTILGDRVNLGVNTTLVTRNVRDRGANDLTWPDMIGYIDYSDPIDPGDEDPIFPPTSSLPDDSSETPLGTSNSDSSPSEPSTSDEENKPSVPLIVGLSVGGGTGVGTALFFIIRFLRKKP